MVRDNQAANSKSADQRAEEALRAHLAADDAITDAARSERDELFRNHITARNILHEELGHFGPPEWNYALDERTRDTLLAHSRQDSSFAAMNAAAAFREISALRRQFSGHIKRDRWLRVAVLPLAGAYLLIWVLG